MAAVENTKTRALFESALLLQQFGYDGFSFEDIAKKLGLRKQSLYVHFKSKEALANDLIDEYRKFLKTWSETVSPFRPDDQVRAWFECIYKSASKDLKYCSIAAFASDYNSIPKSAKKKLSIAFSEIKAWFVGVIEEGQKEKIFRRDFSSEELTELALALAFGGQQMARLENNAEQLKMRQQNALRILKG